jgi:hypothetical protein
MIDKIEWPEDQLDYSDSFTIKITKVKFDGDFTHWEGDLSFADDGFYCGVTAPDMASAIDEVMNYLYDSVYEWTKDDANAKSNR